MNDSPQKTHSDIYKKLNNEIQIYKEFVKKISESNDTEFHIKKCEEKMKEIEDDLNKFLKVENYSNIQKNKIKLLIQRERAFFMKLKDERNQNKFQDFKEEQNTENQEDDMFLQEKEMLKKRADLNSDAIKIKSIHENAFYLNSMLNDMQDIINRNDDQFSEIEIKVDDANENLEKTEFEFKNINENIYRKFKGKAICFLVILFLIAEIIFLIWKKKK